MTNNSETTTTDERITQLENDMKLAMKGIGGLVKETLLLKIALGLLMDLIPCDAQNCEACKPRQTTNNGGAQSTTEKKQDVNKEAAAPQATVANEEGSVQTTK